MPTGDGVDRLDGFLAADDALAGQPTDLGQAAPCRRQVIGDAGGRFQAAGLDPAVTLLDRLGLLEVRRRRPFRRGESGPKAKAMSAFRAGWLSLTVKK